MNDSIPKWLIIAVIVAFFIGVIFLVIGNVNHNVNQKKTAGNKVMLGLGYILMAPGLLFLAVIIFLAPNPDNLTF